MQNVYINFVSPPPQKNFGHFFNCTNTFGNNIWSFANTTETIEFRTTIYFTNVRPVETFRRYKGRQIDEYIQ